MNNEEKMKFESKLAQMDEQTHETLRRLLYLTPEYISTVFAVIKGRDDFFIAHHAKETHKGENWRKGYQAATAENAKEMEGLKEKLEKGKLPQERGYYGPHDQIHIQHNIGFNAAIDVFLAILTTHEK